MLELNYDKTSQSIFERVNKTTWQNAILTETEDLLPYLKDERGLLESDCSLIIRPNAPEEI